MLEGNVTGTSLVLRASSMLKLLGESLEYNSASLTHIDIRMISINIDKYSEHLLELTHAVL